jgi:protein arginine kinase
LKTKKFEQQIDKLGLDIMWNDRLGFITSNPKNLGTALKITVRIKLPHLSDDGRLETILKILDLSQRTNVVDDEAADTPNKTLEISSKFTLGKSEIEISQQFIDSIQKLINIDKKVGEGMRIDEFI